MQITLTPKAEEMAGKLLKDISIEDIKGIRVGLKGGGCSGFQYVMEFETETPRDNDTIIQFNGFNLIIDPHSLTYLMGTEIDYQEGLMGAGFKFNTPGVKGSCGCGSSVQF